MMKKQTLLFHHYVCVLREMQGIQKVTVQLFILGHVVAKLVEGGDNTTVGSYEIMQIITHHLCIVCNCCCVCSSVLCGMCLTAQ